MNRKYTLLIFLLFLSAFFTIMGFKTKTSVAESPAGYTPAKVFIKVQPEGKILNYSKTSIYSVKVFSEISNTFSDFSHNEIENLKNDLKRYDKEGLNCSCTPDTSTNSVTLNCDINGAMYDKNSYDFHWLLGDLPFDLYQFTQKVKELTYTGKIEGIPTTIKLMFDYKITHCHEHVWPAR